MRFILLLSQLFVLSGCNSFVFDNDTLCDQCTCSVTEVMCENLTDTSLFSRYSGHRVKALSIRNSVIDLLDVNDFRQFWNISELNLLENEAKLAKDSFACLRNLLVLRIEKSLCSDIPDYLFYNNTQLSTLSLKGNNLRFIPVNIFKHLKQIYNLDLSYNELRALEPGIFEDNVNLKTLDLSNNELNILSENVFNFSHRKSRLNLSHNNISKFDKNTFKMCSKLSHLLLDYNCISSLSDGLFDGLLSLRVLNVSYNQIQSISVPLLYPMNALSVLNLNSNELTSLDIYFVTFINQRLLEVSLLRNPFECICGPLVAAFYESLRLGLKITLTCKDGQSWTTLKFLDCTTVASNFEDESASTAFDSQNFNSVRFNSVTLIPWTTDISVGNDTTTVGENVLTVSSETYHEVSRDIEFDSKNRKSSDGVIVLMYVVSVVILMMSLFSLIYFATYRRRRRQMVEITDEPLLSASSSTESIYY